MRGRASFFLFDLATSLWRSGDLRVRRGTVPLEERRVFLVEHVTAHHWSLQTERSPSGSSPLLRPIYCSSLPSPRRGGKERQPVWLSAVSVSARTLQLRLITLIFDGVLLLLSLSLSPLSSPNCPITSLTFGNNQLNHNPPHRVTHLPPFGALSVMKWSFFISFCQSLATLCPLSRLPGQHFCSILCGELALSALSGGETPERFPPFIFQIGGVYIWKCK